MLEEILKRDDIPSDVREAIKRELAEKIRLEDQLRQAQKMEAVGRLAGGVAHDFNNILTVITGYAGLLEPNITGTNQKGHLSQIQRAAERASDLTRQLLAFSRQQVIQPKVVETNFAINSVEKMLRRLIGEDIDFTTRFDPDAGYIKIDVGQLEQALVNLAVNARDAMPKGGKLTIETAQAVLDAAYSDKRFEVKQGNYAMIAITDTGTGMDKETKSHLFEPFFTTKELGRGTGLGLATVYGIVKQHNGYIFVYSEPSQGTTFKLYFPQVDKSEKTDSDKLKRRTKGGKETILLVEDEEPVRQIIRSMLEIKGYKIIVAASPSEAQRLCGKNIDLLITDVVMPEMDGRALAANLCSKYTGLRVLYISGYTHTDIVNRGVLPDDVHFLEKPFNAETLDLKVREALGDVAANR